MIDLSSERNRRIAEARRQAESILKRTISRVPKSRATCIPIDIPAYLPAFETFACSLFDAEAEELLSVCEDAECFKNALANDATLRIIERIRPEWDTSKSGATKQCIAANHGDWENFTPRVVALWARFPHVNQMIRKFLKNALQQRAIYWEGRFEFESPGGEALRRADAGLAKLSKTALGLNIDRLRKECGWSFDDLARETGLDKTTTLAHVNAGRGARPGTLRLYADAFSREFKKFGKPGVTVAELERAEPQG
jgi:hypothetical protein